MSNLPQYSRVPTEMDDSPLSKSGRRDFDLEAQLTPSGEQIEVVYTFVPRYPVSGAQQEVISVLGATRQASTNIVQAAFPVLADYPADRIQFLVPLGTSSAATAVVTDEAWARFRRAPPQTLTVQIQDGPGDEESRMRYAERQAFQRSLLHDHLPVVFWMLFSLLMLFFLVAIGRYAIKGRE